MRNIRIVIDRTARVGDILNGERVVAAGRPVRIQVTDDTACVYGLEPGESYYPSVTRQIIETETI